MNTDQVYTETTNTNLVAVYGTLRKGSGNHFLLENDESVFRGTERISGWEMFYYGSFLSFPWIKPTEDIGSSIVVEVYEVSDDVMEDLDSLEGYNPNNPKEFYDRTQVETQHGMAWIYFMEDGPKHYPIPTGDYMMPHPYKDQEYAGHEDLL